MVTRSPDVTFATPAMVWPFTITPLVEPRSWIWMSSSTFTRAWRLEMSWSSILMSQASLRPMSLGPGRNSN